MKRVISVHAKPSETYDRLNRRAAAYAAEKNLEYIWRPQERFTPEGVAGALRDADAGIIGGEPYGREIFEEIRGRCKLLIRYGVGYDAVDLSAASANGIAVAKTTAVNAESVAELALSLIMAAARQHPRNRNAILKGDWTPNIGVELYRKKLGIVGFGAIGRRLAKLFQGFEVELLAYSPSLTQAGAAEAGARLAGIDEIFRECDIISLHMPYTEKTRHLVNRDRLAMMKETAVLVSTARGNIIDEDALYEALKERRILGAGLDVFSVEPLPADSPLLELDNLVLTPHIGSQTENALWNMYEKAIDIAAAFLNGEALAEGDLINPEYRRRQDGKGIC